MQKDLLLIGTRKGLAVYRYKKGNWQFENMHFSGIPVSLAQVDTRNGTWWACLDHGHWGVKLHRSNDEGQNWEEIAAPKFPEGKEVKEGVPASVNYLWAFAEGGNDHPAKFWLGTVPGGLFSSNDNGASFNLIESLWDHPSRGEWFGGGFDNAGIHSVVVDPRNSDHIYIGISCAGVFETTDAGKTWTVRNKGLRADFLPDPFAEVGHDPHMLLACNTNPDVLWQQNHCGIFRSTDGAKTWVDVSDKNKIADFGFCISIDPDNTERAWVVPAISDEIRIAKGAAMTVCRTDDGGKTWVDFRKGLPQEGCYDIVYRHSLDSAGNRVAFGTTCGNLFLSEDAGESWDCLNHYLPMVYSVHFAN
ncbi:MAG: sialidase family protein [Bacteroidota bacterium]